MFDRILVANRGEIACRVIQTARSLGVQTVVVHSEVDQDAKHVAMADQAVCVGKATPAESYLRGGAIVDAALATGAQAIHPGYGFLSENPEFVEAVEAAGLVFIGPSANAIRAMGLKDAAKKVMEEAGVPVVPGYHGADQDDALLAREAEKIGFPVLIKAVAGGGGKGMRLVEAASGFQAGLDSARAEAKAAFGNSDVLIEKFVSQPRHIEVQVFGDGSRAVHLFERDCSLQRRHQKVIEEAPAPGMTEDMRGAMGAAAVKAAEAIGYKGAGTVEFIVDGSDGLRADRFFFMEMNTRLQVEHPVTEAITGVDLVEWQLRVASGEPLPARQEDLSISGHSFEARLYAEDVPKGFLPATGTLTHLEFPKTVRADSGVRAGDTISPFYDPMIAKIIVHGASRNVALAKLRRALAETHVAGTVTNLAFLGALARHDGFARGEVDTGLIGRDIEALTAVPTAKPEHFVAAAQAAMRLQAPDASAGFGLWGGLKQSIRMMYQEAEHVISVQVQDQTRQLWQVDETEVLLNKRGETWFAGDLLLAQAVVAGLDVTVFDHYGLQFRCIDPLVQTSDGAADAAVIVAPMPGLVRDVFTKAGQTVQQGDRLAVLEAMKMEHALLAARDGVVAEVLANAGDQVEAGAALIRLEDESEG